MKSKYLLTLVYFLFNAHLLAVNNFLFEDAESVNTNLAHLSRIAQERARALHEAGGCVDQLIALSSGTSSEDDHSSQTEKGAILTRIKNLLTQSNHHNEAGSQDRDDPLIKSPYLETYKAVKTSYTKEFHFQMDVAREAREAAKYTPEAGYKYYMLYKNLFFHKILIREVLHDQVSSLYLKKGVSKEDQASGPTTVVRVELDSLNAYLNILDQGLTVETKAKIDDLSRERLANADKSAKIQEFKEKFYSSLKSYSSIHKEAIKMHVYLSRGQMKDEGHLTEVLAETSEKILEKFDSNSKKNLMLEDYLHLSFLNIYAVDLMSRTEKLYEKAISDKDSAAFLTKPEELPPKQELSQEVREALKKMALTRIKK